MENIDPQTRVEIEQLVAEHNWLVDHGQADRIWTLYTADAVSHGPMGTMTGRDAIRAWGAKRVTVTAGLVRHVFGGLRLAFEDGVLRGTVYYVAYRDGSEEPLVPASVGEFQDEYGQEDGRWLIRRRAVVPVFGGRNAVAHAQHLREASRA